VCANERLQRTIRFAFHSLWFFLLIAFSATASAGEMEPEYQRFSEITKILARQSLPDETLITAVSAAYADLRSRMGLPGSLPRLTISELRLLFKAADEAAFYSSSATHANDMLAIATELARKRALEDSQTQKVYSSLIAARDYMSAGAWRTLHRIVIRDATLEIHDSPSSSSTEPTELALVGDDLIRIKFRFPEGGFVVAVGDPQCHFTQYAIEDIMDDPVLKKTLAGRMKWISPQQRNESLSPFYEWNRRYPDAPISQAYLMSEWKMIDEWQTPTFYFFEDGVLKSKFAGWPREGRKELLRDSMNHVGIRTAH
jgi:hypothetical protein